ncbi:MAG: cheY, partial [Myxococcales bacterium]|nr:cheY [Myxococcales bacterium]
LSFEGLDVAVADHGADAMTWLRAHGEQPWIVLLDLMMPVMDGRAFLDARARDPELARIPVIVLTAGGDCRELRATQAIATCFQKTVKLPDLVAAISRCE